jgi:hypothetical protein
MKLKVLLLALGLTLLLAYPGFTADVEVTDVKINWLTKSRLVCRYRGDVQVINHADVRYQVYVRLT